MAKVGSSDSLEFAPLRSLDDFLLESARFQVPSVKDLEKWNNRIMNNLLYYQTNYFLLMISVFLIVGLMHPGKMALGILAVAGVVALFYYISNNKRAATHFRKNHPFISVFLMLAGGYLVVYMLGSVVVFLFGILLPIFIIMVHASLRLRNLKNKITNKIESVGLKSTPMGIFLESLGQTGEFS